MTVIVDGRVVLLGGITMLGAAMKTLDTTAVAEIGADGRLGTWRAGPALPTPVMHHTCSVFGRTLHCVGGRIAGNVTSTLAVYATLGKDGTLGPFAPMSALPASLGFHQAFVHGERLYVAGGLERDTASADFTRKKEVFSLGLDAPATNPWVHAGDLPAARNVGAAEAVGDRVYLSGGIDASDQLLDSIVAGDFAADGSVTFTKEPAKLSSPRMHVHQTPSWGRFMYFVGGRDALDHAVGVIDRGTFE